MRQGLSSSTCRRFARSGQRVHLLRVVGQRARFFVLWPCPSGAHDLLVQVASFLLASVVLACTAVPLRPWASRFVAIEQRQAVAGAGQLRGKVGVDGECVGAARLVRARVASAPPPHKVSSCVWAVCRSFSGYLPRGSGFERPPALLARGCRSRWRQRLQLLFFVLQLRLGGGGVQVFGP